MTSFRVSAFPIAITAIAWVALSPPNAAAAEPSFDGKVIRMIINSAAGGGTDANGRMMGTMMAEHLLGKPQIIFQNMPGGGGIKANNYFYASVKPDGMTMLSGSRTQISPTKLRSSAVKYDPSKYRFLGGIAQQGTLVLVNQKEAHRLTDRSAPPLVFGGIDGERTAEHAAVWGSEFLGWNIRFVMGYSGTPDLLLAARRGEIDMVHSPVLSNIAELVKNGIAPLVQLGNPDDDGRMVERSAYKGLPVFSDLMEGKLDVTAQKAYRIWLDDQIVDKWIALPPGTSDEYTTAYRAAYQAVVKDPRFVEITKREFGDEVAVLTGKHVDELVGTLVAISDDDLAYFTHLREKHGLSMVTKQ